MQGFLIVLISIIVCLLLIILIVHVIKRGVIQIKRGINTLSTIQSMVEEESHQAPRQLQNLTQTYESIIKRDFPQFDVREFLSSAEIVMLSILNALESGAFNHTDNWSPNLKKHVLEILTDIDSKKEKWIFDDIHIHKSAISNYRTQTGSKTIIIQIAIQYRHGILKHGELISGNNEIKQYKYELEAIYIQDPSKMGDGSLFGHHCPNCGAPVKQVGDDKYCLYCGTGLIEINVRTWTFDHYKRC